ncbi:MAG: pseudouridine synthase [Candidatus Moranbacteria bacterium]|nr:pseudouridine synthase [Candidatus Moranbacteria bacterium]
MLYPIRINKYLADKKIASRREADELIRNGKILINGKKAELGEMVQESDKVEVEGDLKKLVYLAFNKPIGIITHSPQGDEIGINDILKFDVAVFPLGRLDKDSHGLIILTNDGRMTDRLLNPIFEHEKEYEVEVVQKISDNFIKQMEGGVKLDGGYVTQKCKLKKLDDHLFSIILTEGKKRQIRRMCTALGYEVRDLRRVRVMNIELGSLKEGRHRIISGAEREEFLGKLEL